MSKVSMWNYNPDDYKGCNEQIEALKNDLRIGDSIKLIPQKRPEITDYVAEPIWWGVIGIYPDFVICECTTKSGESLQESFLYHEILLQKGAPLHAFSKAV